MMIPQAASVPATASTASAASSASGQAVLMPDATVSGGVSNAAGVKGGATFANMLVQMLNGDASASTQVTALNLADLLKGLTPELLESLLRNGQQGTDDAGAVPDELLTLLGKQPELLDSLLDSDDFQRWLSQAAELLQGMQLIPQLTQMVQTQPEQVPATDAAKSEAPALMTKVEAHAIISAFAAAASTQKDSVLMQQLKEDFADLLKPLMGDASIQTPAMKQELQAAAQPAGSESNLQQNVSAQTPFAKISAPAKQQQQAQAFAASSNVVQELIEKLQGSVRSGNAVSKLEVLAAKAGLADRFLNAQPAADLPEALTEAKTDASTERTPSPNVQLQDMLKLPGQTKPASVQTPFSAESFVSEMKRLVMNSFKVGTFNGLTEARLSLTPESLGHVDVKISLQNGQLVAQFAAQTATGKEMIEGQLAQLRASLQQQGIQVEKLEVVQQNSQLSSGMFHEHRQQQSFSQQFSRRSKGNYTEERQDDFAAEMVQMIRNDAQKAGGGFDVTA